MDTRYSRTFAERTPQSFGKQLQGPLHRTMRALPNHMRAPPPDLPATYRNPRTSSNFGQDVISQFFFAG